MKMIGEARNVPRGRERMPINIHPDVRERLRDVLFEDEMRGVGYSEFINRACEIAESEIAQERFEEKARAKSTDRPGAVTGGRYGCK